MGELQAARQRGLSAYFSGTKLVTRMKRIENVASLGTPNGTVLRDEASGRGDAVQIETDLTGSAEEGGDTRAQADTARPVLEATTDVLQASKSMIPQPAKQMSAAAAVKKGINTRINSSHGKFIK